MLRKLFSFPVLIIALGAPAMASAQSAGALCAAAEANPGAFVQRADFAQSVLKMARSCPTLAFSLTNVPTGSIPSVKGSGKDGNKGLHVTTSADHSALIARLAKATKSLDAATARVDDARADLETSIRRARKAGLSDADLSVAVALDSASAMRDVLPDYTARKRDALDRYLAARDRLDAANRDLAAATEAAKPLVAKALELAGNSAAAQAALAGELGSETAEQRKARLDRELAEAKALVDSLTAKIAHSTSDLNAAKAELERALNSDSYTAAKAAVASAKTELEKARSTLTTAETNLAAAQRTYDEAAARCGSRCTGRTRSDLQNAENALEQAKRAHATAVTAFNTQSAGLAREEQKLADITAQLGLAELSARIVNLTATIAEANGQMGDASAKADMADKQAKNLADLLNRATDALAKAGAARDAATAATEDEEAEVAAAHKALLDAIGTARAALAGSPEEEAALQAVLDAQKALAKALDDLGAARDVADALTEEVKDLVGAPSDVKTAGKALSDAADAADEAEAAAGQTQDDAAAAVADYDDAQSDLEDAVGGDV